LEEVRIGSRQRRAGLIEGTWLGFRLRRTGLVARTFGLTFRVKWRSILVKTFGRGLYTTLAEGFFYSAGQSWRLPNNSFC